MKAFFKVSIVIILIAICLPLLLANKIHAGDYKIELGFSLFCFLSSIYLIFKMSYVKNRLTITPTVAFTCLYIIFIYIGSMLHFLYSEQIVYTIQYPFQSHNYNLLFLVNLGLVFVAFSTVLANRIYRFNPEIEVEKFAVTKLIQDMPILYKHPIFIGTLILCIGAGQIAILLAPTIPLFYSIAHPGDVERITELRQQFSSTPGIGWLQFFYITIFSFCSLFLILWITSIKSYITKIMPLILIPVLLFYLLMSGHRSYFLGYIWMLILLIQFTNIKFNITNIIKVFSIFLGGFAIITILKFNINLTDLGELSYLGYLTAMRFFFAQMLPLAFLTEAFPSRFSFLWGTTYLEDITVFLPGVQYTFPMWIGQQLTPGIAAISTAPPTIVGEFYANFSMWGACIALFLLGFLMQVGYIRFIRSPKKLSNICLNTYIIFACSYLILSGIFFGLVMRLLPVLLTLLVFKYTYHTIIVRPYTIDKVTEK